MTTQEKIVILEDLFELNAGELAEGTVLFDLDNWDSMTKLSLIVMMDDEFGKKLTGDQIRAFQTVKDILDYMS